MVCTWETAAGTDYYTRQRETEYYAGNDEPPGVWYAPAADFGLADGSLVERRTFERLYAAVDESGRSLLEQARQHRERTPAFDLCFSAPRSVSLAWAFASSDTKQLIEAAHHRAVRAALTVVEREAAWARRGRKGGYIERVPLTAGMFQHGESRPAKHADGRIFADPNLHVHAVVVNISTRRDHTVGGLHSKVVRDAKMLAGSIYHSALAHEIGKLGFAIDRIRKNGIFEIAGVEQRAIRYFSVRRQEIEEALEEHDVTSAEAPALAAGIAKATRSAKQADQTVKREEVWADAARSIGIEVESFTERLRDQTRVLDRAAGEKLLGERLAALPRVLTEHESVFPRRELIRSVAAALVGTGLPAERADAEVDRLLDSGAVLEIGWDDIGLPFHSTPEMVAIEREVVATAQALASRPWHQIDQDKLAARCRAAGLNAEQTDAVRTACAGNAIAIIEGAPGAGKTTTLMPIVQANRERWEADREHGEAARGHSNVIATASVWRIANQLRDDLGIEARATASWLAKIRTGEKVLDSRTVIIADEAGLLSAREMHALLGAVSKAGAKILLVGDRKQLQAIGAGPGLHLVARTVEAARVDTIVRQRQPWVREAITAFGAGRAATALGAFADRGLLIEAPGAKAALTAVVDAADQARSRNPKASVLILAKSNAAVAAISREVRERKKAAGLITGKEVSLTAATPSGHKIEIALARGDKIRFLVRDDALGVVNGTIATVTKVSERRSQIAGRQRIRIEAEISGRRVSFDPMRLADVQGRPRLGWGYAATIYGSQGLTVEEAVVHVDAAYNRYDIHTATSRSRERTTLVVDAKAIDWRLTAERPIDLQRDDIVFSGAQRRAWLAERLSRACPKISTLDVIEQQRVADRQPEIVRRRERELSHEL